MGCPFSNGENKLIWSKNLLSYILFEKSNISINPVISVIKLHNCCSLNCLLHEYFIFTLYRIIQTIIEYEVKSLGAVQRINCFI